LRLLRLEDHAAHSEALDDQVVQDVVPDLAPPVRHSVRGLVRRQLKAQFHQASTRLLPFLPRRLRRVDRGGESAFADLPQEDRTAEQFLQDSDREAHLIRLVLHGLAAPRPDELIEVRLTMGRGRVYLRGRNVLFSEHAHVREGLEVAGDEETMKRISVLPQLLRKRADGALLHPQVRDDKVLEIALRDEQRAPTRPSGNKPDNKKRFPAEALLTDRVQKSSYPSGAPAFQFAITPPFFFVFPP